MTLSNHLQPPPRLQGHRVRVGPLDAIIICLPQELLRSGTDLLFVLHKAETKWVKEILRVGGLQITWAALPPVATPGKRR